MSDTSLTKVRDHQLRFDLPPGVVGDATSFRARVGLVDNFGACDDRLNWVSRRLSQLEDDLKPLDHLPSGIIRKPYRFVSGGSG